jgi:hypothetical protein
MGGTWDYNGEWECVFYDKIEQRFWGLAQAGSVTPVKAKIGQGSASGICGILLENFEADRFPSSTILALQGIPTKGNFSTNKLVNDDRTLEIVFYDTHRKKFKSTDTSGRVLSANLTFTPTPTINIPKQSFDGAWVSGNTAFSPERILAMLGSKNTSRPSTVITVPTKAEITAAHANYLKLTTARQRSHFWDSTLAILSQKKYMIKTLPNAAMPENLLKSIGTEFVTKPQESFLTFEAIVQKKTFASNSFGGKNNPWRGNEVEAKYEVINVLCVVLARTFNPNLGGARTYKKGKTLLGKSRKIRRGNK